MDIKKIAESFNINVSLLELVTAKIDEDKEKKKGEKIIINPELNHPNSGPSSGNSSPDVSGQTNVNGERAQS